LTSALGGSEWSVSRTGRLSPWERASVIHVIEGCVGPRAGLDAEGNKKKESLPLALTGMEAVA